MMQMCMSAPQIIEFQVRLEQLLKRQMNCQRVRQSLACHIRIMQRGDESTGSGISRRQQAYEMTATRPRSGSGSFILSALYIVSRAQKKRLDG